MIDATRDWIALHEATRLLENELGSFFLAREQLLNALCEKKIVTRASRYIVASRRKDWKNYELLENAELDHKFWQDRRKKSEDTGFDISFETTVSFKEYYFDDDGKIELRITINDILIHKKSFDRAFPFVLTSMNGGLIANIASDSLNASNENILDETEGPTSAVKTERLKVRMTAQKAACQTAFRKIFPEGMPSRSDCTDKQLIYKVQNYQKSENGIVPSDDTILREAGRKKRRSGNKRQ